MQFITKPVGRNALNRIQLAPNSTGIREAFISFTCCADRQENVSFESRRASKCIGCSLPAVTSVMVTFIMNRGGRGGVTVRCGGGDLQSTAGSAEAEVELQTSVSDAQSNAKRYRIKTLLAANHHHHHQPPQR